MKPRRTPEIDAVLADLDALVRSINHKSEHSRRVEIEADPPWVVHRSEAIPMGQHRGTIAVSCWCEEKTVRVPIADFRAGRTRTCGHPECTPLLMPA